MKAMRIHQTGTLNPKFSGLSLDQIAVPFPGQQELLIHVHFCGVCHTELDEIENRASPTKFPMTPGHQVVGTVILEGPNCRSTLVGRTVGVAWIHSCCGNCAYCLQGRENLCPQFQACGKDQQGGYAEYMTVGEDFVYPIPDSIPEAQAAPLLCAGAVGFRALLAIKSGNIRSSTVLAVKRNKELPINWGASHPDQR